MASYRVRRDKIRKVVIFDTSGLLLFFEVSLDWEQEIARVLPGYLIVVPSKVIKELETLSTHGNGETRRKAKASLQFVRRYEIVATDALEADDAVLEAAKKTHGAVFTNDTKLRHRLRKEGISVLFLRGRKRLFLDE
jgi:rRNA-processing protein FCF1